MRPQLFTNVKIFDGTGAESFPGEALVDGNTIRAVARGSQEIPRGEQIEVIDGKGHTLMPGLCEAHSHITYSNMTYLKELGQIPPEEHLLLAIGNAKLMLDSGYTSLYSAASSKIRTEIVLRNAINAGKVVGPRLRAASPEIVATGGLGDERQMHLHHQGIEVIADGADEVRRTMSTVHRVEISGAFGHNILRIGQMGEQSRAHNLFRTLHAFGASLRACGFAETITALTLGNATTTAAGNTTSIIDTATGGVLRLTGNVTYNAGTVGFENGQTLISADLDLNNATRTFTVNDNESATLSVTLPASAAEGSAAVQGTVTLSAAP